MFNQYWPLIKRHLISFIRVFLVGFLFFISSTANITDVQAVLKGAAIAGLSAVAKALYEWVVSLSKDPTPPSTPAV